MRYAISRHWRKFAAAGAFAGILLVGLWWSSLLQPPTVLGDLIRGGEPQVVKLGVVYAANDVEGDFLKGVELAVKEVNEEGGIDGLALEVLAVPEAEYNEEESVEDVTARSMELASNLVREDLLAVIGHEWSATAVPASGIYNRAGTLFLATHATATSLTSRGFDHVFQLQPSNADNAAVMASYALSLGLERFVVLTDKTGYGEETGKFFRTWITRAGGEIVFRGYLAGHLRSVDKLMLFLLGNDLFDREDYDAIYVVASSAKETGLFVRRLRELGVDLPVLGAESLFHSATEAYVGTQNMKGVAAVSLYDSDSASERATRFLESFQQAYGKRPDLTAAVGYDAVKLLRDASLRAGTRDPQKLADTLRIARYEEPFVGATGPLVFDENGLITDTAIYVVRHDGARFWTNDEYRLPLKWRFSERPEDTAVYFRQQRVE